MSKPRTERAALPAFLALAGGVAVAVLLGGAVTQIAVARIDDTGETPGTMVSRGGLDPLGVLSAED